MLTAPLAGLSLLLNVSIGPVPNGDTGAPEISFRQKTAAIQPLIRSAT